jgi:glycine cleavage system H lipoate-binding protein
MTCPFLKETQVKFCQMAGVRKLIPLTASTTGSLAVPERCTSTAYSGCPVFVKQPVASAAVARCPWLQESLMQYCGGAPVPRFIPYSESMLSRCGNGSFRYCDVYIGLAHPERDADEVDGVRVPTWLRYTANHMWLDVAPDGTCHAGIDDFLARALGPVERIGYVWLKGQHRPVAIFTAGGVDVQIVFPNPMLLTGCNLYLRPDPSRCTTEPYTAGWLFEGKVLPETTADLIEGAAVRTWIEQEHGHMNEFIHEHLIPESAGALSADGGVFSPGMVHTLEREQVHGLFQEFFSPLARIQRKT